jgi:hypothetical protein
MKKLSLRAVRSCVETAMLGGGEKTLYTYAISEI